MDWSQVLLGPVVTEKSMTLQDANRYTFEVHPRASKHQVREAVERGFGVRVTGVNTARSRGKMRRRGMYRYRTADRRKAVVTLRPGDKIELFEGT